MREILFKGKRVDNNQWVYGYYIETKPRTGIHGQGVSVWDVPRFLISTKTKNNTMYDVHKETVCEYSGLENADEKWVFEGDILSVTDFYEGDHRVKGCDVVVVFEEGEFSCRTEEGDYISLWDAIYNGNAVIKGNIHDGIGEDQC